MTRNTWIAGFFVLSLVLAGCGGSDGEGSGSSGGSGTEADRAELSGAMGSTSYGAGDGLDNSDIGNEELVLGAVTRDQTITTECSPQGSMSIDITLGSMNTSGNNTTFDITIAGIADDCGENQFTGTFTESGNLTLNGSSGVVTGSLTTTVSGSTSSCTSINGNVTAVISITSGTGTVTFNGTISGTCSGGSASCTFDDVEISTDLTADEMKTAFCNACDVPAASCD